MLWWVIYNEKGKAVYKTLNETVAYKVIYQHEGWTFRPQYEEMEG